MNIKKTGNINFTGYTNIKTKTPAILNALEDCDFHIWRRMENPECRYSHNAQGKPGNDGFFQGVLQDGEDTAKPLKSCDFGEEFIVQKFDDLEKVPAFRNFMSEIKYYYEQIIKPTR